MFSLMAASRTFSNDNSGVIYFPAYELVLDDLRDYRFFEADLIHQNEIALEYVWEKFSGMFFSPATRALLNEWNSIKKSLNHRFLHP